MKAILSLIALLVGADILPPGHRPVIHELVLEAEDRLATKWKFIAAPVRGFGVREIEIGKPFRFSSKYGTKLWAAAPTDEPPETGHGDAWFDGRPMGVLPMGEIASVPAASLLGRVVTTLRVTDVADTSIGLELVREERFDITGGSVNEVLVIFALVGISMLGMVGLVMMDRRRKPTTNP